jgi:hypothetical protein
MLIGLVKGKIEYLIIIFYDIDIMIIIIYYYLLFYLWEDAEVWYSLEGNIKYHYATGNDFLR